MVMKKGRFGGPFFCLRFYAVVKGVFRAAEGWSCERPDGFTVRAERCVRRFLQCGCGLVLFALVVVAVEAGELPVRQ